MCLLKFSIYVLLRFKTKMKRTSVCKFVFQNNRTKRCTSQSQEKSGKETQTSSAYPLRYLKFCVTDVSGAYLEVT